MKNIKKVGRKKIATVAIAGAVVMGSFGGGAYAYKDAWTAKIQKGVSELATYVFKDDIQSAVKAYGDTKEAQLRQVANATINAITAELRSFKDEEIKRGKDQLDSKYNGDVTKIKEVAEQAKNSEKAKQTNKTNGAITEASNEMDAVVEEYLSQISE
jgi:hypothetical protein